MHRCRERPVIILPSDRSISRTVRVFRSSTVQIDRAGTSSEARMAIRSSSATRSPPGVNIWAVDQRAAGSHRRVSARMRCNDLLSAISMTAGASIRVTLGACFASSAGLRARLLVPGLDSVAAASGVLRPSVQERGPNSAPSVTTHAGRFVSGHQAMPLGCTSGNSDADVHFSMVRLA